MRLPIRWLRDYVAIDAEPAEIAARLDAAGFEVESIDIFGAGCKGLVVGRVEEIAGHPNADKLRLCTVAYGDGARAEVVCGATNFERGDLVAFAPAGSELPGGMRVEARTIRGVTSHGMICSEAEIGVGDDAEGILVLARAGTEEASGIQPGDPLEDVLGLGDAVIDVDITPNRPDAMSVIGLARELAASFGAELQFPPVELKAAGPPSDEKVTVEIQDPKRCPRYIARYIEGVEVGPSPHWMALRLREAGLRPINNVVDVTNYVLLEIGHPLHAFDYSKIREGRILVRLARDGEKILALDGVERTLTADDLVIADPDGALAIAGVIGGESSAISEATVAVLLESAYFEPTGILRTAKRHGLRTESSARFERGCDPEGAMWASKRACSLLEELTSANVGASAVDVYPKPIEPSVIRLSFAKANRILGAEISVDRQQALLSSIGLKVEREEEALRVEVPTFRPDLSRDIDLVEEIGRLYGYDNIEKTLPASGARIGRLDRSQRIRRLITEVVRGCGFSAVKNFSMVSPEEVPERWAGRTTRLSNPLRTEESVLRPTLIPGLLKSAGNNLARRRQDLRLFEVGTVFEAAGDDGIPPEYLCLGGVVVLASGRAGRQAHQIGDHLAAPEFFEAKGALEAVLEAGHIREVEFAPARLDGFHPVRCAVVRLAGEEVGLVAEVAPETGSRFGVDATAAVFEIRLDRVVELFSERPSYAAISRYPPVFFDLSFVISEQTPAAAIVEAVRRGGGELLERCELLDVYRSPSLGEGRKSVTVSVTLAALDRTLTDEEASAVRARIIETASHEAGAQLRGSDS